MKTSLRNIQPNLLISLDIKDDDLSNAEVRSRFKKEHPEIREIIFLDSPPVSNRSAAVEICSADSNLVLYRAVAVRYNTQDETINFLVMGLTTLC